MIETRAVPVTTAAMVMERNGPPTVQTRAISEPDDPFARPPAPPSPGLLPRRFGAASDLHNPPSSHSSRSSSTSECMYIHFISPRTFPTRWDCRLETVALSAQRGDGDRPADRANQGRNHHPLFYGARAPVGPPRRAARNQRARFGHAHRST